MLSVPGDEKEGRYDAYQDDQQQEAGKKTAPRPTLGRSDHKVTHARGTIPPTRKEVS